MFSRCLWINHRCDLRIMQVQRYWSESYFLACIGVTYSLICHDTPCSLPKCQEFRCRKKADEFVPLEKCLSASHNVQSDSCGSSKAWNNNFVLILVLCILLLALIKISVASALALRMQLFWENLQLRWTYGKSYLREACVFRKASVVPDFQAVGYPCHILWRDSK